MVKKSALRPIFVILTVLYGLNGVLIVLRQGIVSLIDRLAEDPRILMRFLRFSGTAELLLFTAAVGICLLLAALASEGRGKTAFFVLSGGCLALLAANLISRATGDLFLTGMIGQLVCALCGFAGYVLLASSERSVRAAAWICAALVPAARFCSAFSVFSAAMMDSGEPLLWKTLYIRSAQLSPVFSIVACIAQAYCFLLLFFEYGKHGMKSGVEDEKEEPEQGA